MIDVKTQAIKKFESQLKAFRDRAFPFATKSAVNMAAFAAQRNAKERVRREFIIRNKWTEQSIRVTPTRTLNVDRQESIVGSISDYMEVQEFGGLKKKKGEYGVPIPTSFSAGESENAIPRRKLPRGTNKMRSVKLSQRSKSRTNYTSKRQAAKVTVLEAAKTNQKFVFLDLDKTKGIFKITGGARKPKVKMIYDLSRPSVRIKSHPWLRPSMLETRKIMPNLYFKALKFQLERNNLFKKL